MNRLPIIIARTSVTFSRCNQRFGTFRVVLSPNIALKLTVLAKSKSLRTNFRVHKRNALWSISAGAKMNVRFIGFGVCSMLASVLDLADWVSHREIERRSIVRHADADSAYASRITRNQCSSIASVGCFESYVNHRRWVPLIADPIAVKAVGSSQQKRAAGKRRGCRTNKLLAIARLSRHRN
jgi:hypothetical protein